MREVKCPIYGTKYTMIDSDAEHYAACYVTSACFDGDDAIIVARFTDGETVAPECTLVRVDLNTGDQQDICKAWWPTFRVQNGLLYYGYNNMIYERRLSDGKTREIHEFGVRASSINLTRDGRYMSTYNIFENGMCELGMIDVETCEYTKLLNRAYPRPFNTMGHSMVNPYDPKWVFYCHEGTCEYVMDRMWLLNTETGKSEVFFHQKLDDKNENGEPCGHEMWSADGKKMYFVKYRCGTIAPLGVWCVELDSRKAYSIASKFPYWHVGVSPDGRFLAGDTQGEGPDFSTVVLIDLKNNTEVPIVRAGTFNRHPCHPHAVFSPSGKKVCFTTVNERGKMAVGVYSLDK